MDIFIIYQIYLVFVDIRRVQITGGSSYMITLPKDWAESVNLKKNDPIEIQAQTDGSLILFPNGTSSDGQYSVKTIDADKVLDEDFLYRQLIGAYIAGHSRIKVTSLKQLSSTTTNVVSNFTKVSIGMEVLEEDETHVLIKDLMDHTELNPTKSIERMKVLVKNMLSDVYNAAYTGNMNDISNMNSKDVEVDRIHWLISRQCSIHQKDITLSKKMNLDPCYVTRCLSISRIIERIGDHAVLVSKNLNMLSKDGKIEGIDKSVCDIGNEIQKLFDTSVAGWLGKNMDVAESCIESGKNTVKRIKTLFKLNAETDIEIASATNLIASSSRRIAEYCIDISEQTINAAMD